MDENRLDRIEAKLDKLTEAIADLRVLELGITNLNTRVNRHEWRLDQVESLQEKTAIQVARMDVADKMAAKALWLSISTVIGSVGYVITQHIL